MARYRQFLAFAVLISFLNFGANGIFIGVDKRNRPFSNNIVIHCTDDDEKDLDTMNIELRRTIFIDGQSSSQMFTDFSVETQGQALVTITPSNEGNFSCVVSNMISTNSIPIIAYPTVDPEFTAPQSYQVLVGASSLGIRCSFQLGVLTEYYDVTWYRGTTPLDNDSSKYQILSNLSLVIHNADLRDSSDSYYCEVHISNVLEDVVYSEFGVDSSLLVYSRLNLKPNSLYSSAVEAGSSAHFSCVVESAPAGSITWLVNGRELPTNDLRYSTQSAQVNATDYSITVSSRLTITGLEPEDSALIQCIGHVDNGVETLVESNEATLSVIGNNFLPKFEVTHTNLLLSIIFPGTIFDAFTIHIRYTSSVDAQNILTQTLNSATFHHTSTITNFTIPQNKLPLFNSFTAEVAIEVLGLLGQYSQASTEPITLPRSTASSSTSALSSTSSKPTPLNTCSSNRGSGTAQSSTRVLGTPLAGRESVSCACSSAIPLVAVVVVLVLSLISVIVILIMVILCYRGKLSKFHKQEDSRVTFNNKEDRTHIQGLSNSCYTRESISSQSQTSHSSQSHTSLGTHCSSNSHNYSSITPSRPSSEESFYADKSQTVSPPPLPHIYENDETLTLSKKIQSKNNSTLPTSTTEPLLEEVYKVREMSSTAVGTSPPKGGKIIPFSKGHSESPGRAGEKREEGEKVLSPARSDPSLESSLKSEYTSKKTFSQNMAIPGGTMKKDQETLTSPTLGEKHASRDFTQSMQTRPTYQQFQYGTDRPPVRRKVENKDDDKIYHKIITEYDVV